VILPLCSALVRHHLEYCVQLSAPQHKRDTDVPEQLLCRAATRVKLLEHLSYEEAERGGPVQPGEKQAQGNLIPVYKYPTGGNEDKGARLFSVVSSDKTRGSGHKPKHGRFLLNITKHFFTVRVIKHRHRLPREAVESPSLYVFKTLLNTVLENLL